MHELALHVQVREVAVHRQGRRQFHHPHQHQRRHLTGCAGDGQDEAGHDGRARHGQHDAPQGLGLGGPQREGPLADGARDPGQPLFGGDDHHRQGQDGQGQRRPDDARGAEGRTRQRFRIEQLVQRTTEGVDEEAQTEHAVHDGGHARQVDHRDADDLGQAVLARVLVQVDRSDDPQRSHDDRHQEHHEDGAEDGREHPALGVGLARIVGDELADLVEPVTHLGRQAHVIGPHHVQHLGHGHGHQLATHVLDRDAVSVRLGTQGEELLLQHLITIVESLTLARQLGFKLIGQLVVQLGLALFQAQPLQLIVDAADVPFLQIVGLFGEAVGPRQHPLQGRMQIRGELAAILFHRDDIAVEVAVGGTLHHGQLRRQALGLDVGLQHPAEVQVDKLAVAGLDQIAGQQLALLPCQRQAGGPQPLDRHQLAVVDFADQHALVALGVFQLPLIDGVGPEVDQTTPADQQQQTQYRYQTQADGAAGHPDPGGPRFKPLTHCRFLDPYRAAHHRELYFSRNR